MSAQAPDERRVDPVQLRALVRLTLRQGFGRGVDASTGSQGNPLLQAVFSMTLVGIMLSTHVRRAVDLPSFLVLIFAATFLIVVLAINPDAQEVVERRLEILGSKPIAPRTFLAARAVIVFITSSLLAGCLGLAPMAAALVYYPFPWPRAAATFGMLVLGSFTCALLWLAALLIGLRFVSIDRVRKTSQLLLLAAILGLSAASAGSIAVRGHTARFDISAWPQALLLPSSWFALFGLDDGLPGAWARRAGVMALFTAAGLVGAGVVLARYYVDFAEQGPPPATRSRSVVVWALERVLRTPGVGPRLLSPAVEAVAEAVLTVTRREDISRAKILAPQLLALGAFFLAWTGTERMATVTTLTYLGFAATLDGLQVARQSSLPAAGWIFWVAPVDPRQVLRGLTLALVLRFLALPAALLSLVFFRMHPPHLAVVLCLGYILTARLVIPLGLALWPAYPLSEDQRSMQSFMGFVVGFVLTVGFTIGQVLFVFLAQLHAGIGVGLGAVGLILLAAVTWGLSRGAASRMVGLEYPH